MEDRIITQEEIKILKQNDKYGLIGTLLYKRKMGVELFKEDRIRLENLAIETGIITEEEELIDRGDRFIIRKIIENENITDKTSEISEINPRLLINEDINESLESDIEELQNIEAMNDVTYDQTRPYGPNNPNMAWGNRPRWKLEPTELEQPKDDFKYYKPRGKKLPIEEPVVFADRKESGKILNIGYHDPQKLDSVLDISKSKVLNDCLNSIDMD